MPAALERSAVADARSPPAREAVFDVTADGPVLNFPAGHG